MFSSNTKAMYISIKQLTVNCVIVRPLHGYPECYRFVLSL